MGAETLINFFNFRFRGEPDFFNPVVFLMKLVCCVHLYLYLLFWDRNLGAPPIPTRSDRE